MPPIIIILLFKVYLNRKFNDDFKFYIPSQADIQAAKIHSERADHKGNRLESRFGHPSLHVELFTPLVHQNMIPLLGSVYKGKISREQLKLQEYGGQKAVGQNVGGIKIAGIEQVSQLNISKKCMSDSNARTTSNTILGCTNEIEAKLTGTPARWPALPCMGPTGLLSWDRIHRSSLLTQCEKALQHRLYMTDT